MVRMFSTVIAAVLLASVVAFPAIAQAPHPLAGQILDTRTGVVTASTDPALIPALFTCGAITLLGEVHDNPDHHKMRGELVDALGRLPATSKAHCVHTAYVFEQISVDQQSGLNRFYEFDRSARRLGTAGDLFRFLNWDDSGWPPARLYTPLLQSVVQARGTIFAGSSGRDSTRKISKEGLSGLDQLISGTLGLDLPFDAALQDSLLSELEASHCGQMPKTAFGNMAVAQRYRDAHLADVAMKAAASTGSTILFAGNGHIRADRGVPYYIRQRAPDQKIIAVAFVETEDGSNDPATYGPRDPQGQPAADYVAFAAPAKRDDPCEGMRAQFKARPKQP